MDWSRCGRLPAVYRDQWNVCFRIGNFAMGRCGAIDDFGNLLIREKHKKQKTPFQIVNCKNDLVSPHVGEDGCKLARR